MDNLVNDVMEDVMLISYDLCALNMGPLTIFAAGVIGLWTLKTNVIEVLSASKYSKASAYAPVCWGFLVCWIFFFIFSVFQARQKHTERINKVINDRKEAQEKKKEAQEKKEQADQVAIQNEKTKKVVEITENATKEIKSLNKEIEIKLGAKIQESEQNIGSQLSARDEILAEKMAILNSRIDDTVKELEKKDKWYNNLLNYLYRSSPTKESISRAKSFSSSSL